MKYIYLTDICRPKQWKTISTSDLHESGYPVYGANGKIGFYHKYTHEFPTVLITCRGATCGTLNISEPKSYVNGNAMALDNLNDNYSLKYLYYILIARGLNDVVSGSAQPQITRENLSKVKIPNPSFPTQQKIANILDKADELRQYNKQLIEKYEALTQSLFLDMFGDPVRNILDFEEIELINLIKDKNDIKCGPFGTQLSKSEYVEFGVPVWGIPQVNSLFVKKPTEYVTKKKAEILKQYSIFPDDIVMSRKGNVGKCAIYPNNWEIGILHSDVLRIRCDKDKISPVFLVWQFRISRRLETQVNDVSSGAIMQGINVSKLKNILAIVPPIILQNQFAERVAIIEAQKQQAQEALAKSEALFQGLLQQAFNGELN